MPTCEKPGVQIRSEPNNISRPFESCLVTRAQMFRVCLCFNPKENNHIYTYMGIIYSDILILCIRVRVENGSIAPTTDGNVLVDYSSPLCTAHCKHSECNMRLVLQLGI